ncbi:TonB-dependent receptor [soil metagenome]
MHVRAAAGPFRMVVMTQFRPVAVLLAAVFALAAGKADVAAQEVPDTVPLAHRPILVRVPGSSFTLGAPRPIAALSGHELGGARAAVFLEEAVQALPGVQIQNRYNFAVGERLSVRGFGGRAQFGVRGVRVLVDGVPATLADGQTTLDHVDVATLGRVEALRGPGASLYGNAAGGVLHFQTRDPPSERLRPEIFTMAGSDGLLQLRGTAGGRGGGVGYVVSAARVNYDGFRRDPLAENGGTYGAARRNSVNATLQLPGGPGRLRATLNWLDLAAENPGSLSEALLAEGDRQAFSNNVRQRTRKDVQQTQFGVSWNGPLLRSTRAEVAGYGVLRSLENPIPSDIVVVERTAWGGRALLEAPTTLAGLPTAVGGGLEFDVQKDDRQNYGNTTGSRGALRLDQLERVRGAGAFGYLRLALLDAADVSAGLRYDRFNFRVRDRFTGGGDPDDSGQRTMDAVSPSVGLVWRPARRTELFGTVSASFETPSTTELANRPGGAGGFNPALQPQRGTTVEAGVRTDIGGLAFLEASVHRTALRDELVPFEVQGVPGRVFFSNAGRSEHRGLEIAASSAGVAGLSGRIAYAYLDAVFRSYTRANAVFDGNRIPGMAPHTLDGVARWSATSWHTEIRGQYRSSVPADDANTAEAPPFFVLDFRTGAGPLRARGMEISPVAGINNVLDRRYVAAVAVNAFGGRFFEPAPGRTFHAGVRASFSRR